MAPACICIVISDDCCACWNIQTEYAFSIHSIGITLLGSCICGSSYGIDIAEKNANYFETVQNLPSCNLRIELSDSIYKLKMHLFVGQVKSIKGHWHEIFKIKLYLFVLFGFSFSFLIVFVAQLTYLKSKLQYIIKAYTNLENFEILIRPTLFSN